MLKVVVLLVALLVAAQASAGRWRMACIYIDGAHECGEGVTARDFWTFPSAGSLVRQVHVGDCIRLPAAILADFKLCCPGTENCVDYTVTREDPPQCVTEYDL